MKTWTTAEFEFASASREAERLIDELTYRSFRSQVELYGATEQQISRMAEMFPEGAAYLVRLEAELRLQSKGKC